MPEATARGKFLRMSPQKVRLVIDLIRGKDANEALDILRFTKKAAAHHVAKILQSAIHNAENRFEDIDVDRLYVKFCQVGDGPRLKRIRPAPMGRAFRYQRSLAHITISVEEREQE